MLNGPSEVCRWHLCDTSVPTQASQSAGVCSLLSPTGPTCAWPSSAAAPCSSPCRVWCLHRTAFPCSASSGRGRKGLMPAMLLLHQVSSSQLGSVC